MTGGGPSAGALDNVTYLVEGTPVPLEGGRYQLKPSPDSATFVANYSRRPPVANGDLDGDGAQDDAATLLVNEPGGSGLMVYLAAVVTGEDGRHTAVTTLLGDRTRVESLTIDAGAIVVSGVRHGPDDPMCCPSESFSQTWRLDSTGALIPDQP